MRRAILTNLKNQNYFNYSVLIFVNDKSIGTGAFFHRLYQALRFMSDCKVEFFTTKYEED